MFCAVHQFDCVICSFCPLVFLVRLSVLVQVIDWNVLIGALNSTHSLISSPKGFLDTLDTFAGSAMTSGKLDSLTNTERGSSSSSCRVSLVFFVAVSVLFFFLSVSLSPF